MKPTRENFETWWFNQRGYSDWSISHIEKIKKCLECEHCTIEKYKGHYEVVCLNGRHRIVTHDSSKILGCSRTCPLIEQEDINKAKLKKLKERLDIHKSNLEKEVAMIKELEAAIKEMED